MAHHFNCGTSKFIFGTLDHRTVQLIHTEIEHSLCLSRISSTYIFRNLMLTPASSRAAKRRRIDVSYEFSTGTKDPLQSPAISIKLESPYRTRSAVKKSSLTIDKIKSEEEISAKSHYFDKPSLRTIQGLNKSPQLKVELQEPLDVIQPGHLLTPTKALSSKKQTSNTKSRTPKTPKSYPPPPRIWEEQFTKIKEFRKTVQAPVDTMGCERLAEEGDEKTFRFQTLVSLMLSSQTKDTVNAVAMKNLQAKGLTVDNVISWSDEELNECICKVGFHKRKTQYIKQTCEILKAQYNGDIPDTIEGLTALPGVGPKMAYLALQCAWFKNEGIGVDVHVHRISNRLKWVKTKEPEETRKALESWLPKHLWTEINPMLVGFGQTVCLPVKPKCEGCPISNTCPSSTVKRTKGPSQIVTSE
ncbi:DNA glycosylase [Paraphysoderma sedebokerense]|nr:DNA glycosylase [Paraphysoderma sedebokerense]